MTLMHIPVCGDIGVEMHPDTDQHIAWNPGRLWFAWENAGKIYVNPSIFKQGMECLFPEEHGTILSIPGIAL